MRFVLFQKDFSKRLFRDPLVDVVHGALHPTHIAGIWDDAFLWSC